jgi:hypothetical protein
MRDTELLAAAVANNASWCDAVCRSHGYPGKFSPRLWTSTRHRLRFYPNAITLRPDVTAAEVLAAAATVPSLPFAVKDSFARLDLASAGFRLLAEGSWIVRDDGPDGPDGLDAPDGPGEPPGHSLSWERVTSPGELRDWETAWAGGSSSGDGPVFQPGLLSDPRCAILVCHREDAIVAGFILYAADGVAGISNVFSAGLPLDWQWGSIQPVVAAMQPHHPVVGYEEGDTLEAARRAGFHVPGTLRIWARPPLLPAEGPKAIPERSGFRP